MFLMYIVLALASGVLCDHSKVLMVKIHKTTCSKESYYARNIICETDENGRGVFGITLIEPVDQIRMCLSTYMGEHLHNIGPLRLTDSLCSYTSEHQEGMMFLLLPFLPKMIGRLIQQCPYEAGRYELFDIEVPTNLTHQHVFSSFDSSGEYRANMRFMDPDDITIFEINTYFYLKKRHEGIQGF